MTARHPEVNRALHVIHERSADSRLTLRPVARQSNVSERHLRRLFTPAVGTTFRQYLRDHRMRRAVELVRMSTYEMKEIAAMVGYADPSHFSHDFRECLGSTPSQFRAEWRMQQQMEDRSPDV